MERGVTNKTCPFGIEVKNINYKIALQIKFRCLHDFLQYKRAIKNPNIFYF